MPFILFIFSNKRWCLIIVLILYSIFQTWQVNSLAGHLNNAETVCDSKVKDEVDKALKPYIDAEKEAQKNANKVSEQYETTREAERVRAETITHNVQKIVERPIYLNNCFDSDGVSAINSLITNDSSEPDSALP